MLTRQEVSEMLPPIVRLVGGLIDEQDGLTAVQNAIRRNKPSDCTLSIGELTSQVLCLANDNLRSSHVFLACFANGDRLAFIGDLLPSFVTDEDVVNVVTQYELKNSA